MTERLRTHAINSDMRFAFPLSVLANQHHLSRQEEVDGRRLAAREPVIGEVMVAAI